MEKTEPVRRSVGYAFGPFVIDSVRRLVWRDSKPVPLSGKSFEILSFLITRRDQVVTKDDLLQEIWPDTFVQENNVVRHVSTLRKTLGQRAEDHDYVLTVQGRGYRFVAPVTELFELPAGLVPSRQSMAMRPEFTTADEHAEVAEEPARHAAAAMASALPTAGPGWSRWWSAAAVFVIIALAVAAWTAQSTFSPGTETRVLRPFTYGPSGSLAPSWSPDGQRLAFASDRDGNFDVFLQGIDETDPIRLTSSPATDWQPAWSPDGEWIAFRSERDGGGVFVIPVAGGPERRVTTFGFEPRWSPDGSLLLVTSSQYLRPRPLAYVVGVDGSLPRPVLGNLAADLREVAYGWHPDGRLSVSGMRDGRWVFITAGVDGTSPISSIELPMQASEREAQDLTFDRFVWSPDGRFVYVEGLSHAVRNLWRVEIDPRTLAWKGRFERLTTGQGIDRRLSISADGNHLAFEAGSERTRIWSFALSAEGQVTDEGVPVTSGASGEFDAAVSRDGRQLVYRTLRDGRQELWQHSIPDGRERRLLADTDAFRSSPRWSPDGASLVYLVSAKRSAAEPEQASLAILSTTDGGERLLRPFDAHQLVPDDWSGDGQSVLGACRSSDPTRSGICLASIGAGAVKMLALAPPFELNNARFSPNQRWISFTHTEGAVGRSTVYVSPIDGGPRIAITDGQAFEDKAHWSPDGRTLYFVSSRGGFLNVWGRRVNPESGQPVGPVFQVTRFDGLRQAFAPDLRFVDLSVTNDRLFVPVTETSRQVWILDDIGR